MVTVLVAVRGRAEADVVTRLQGVPDLDIVRRCADLPELVAAGLSGLAQVAVVSADLPGLDRSVVDDLETAQVRLVGVCADEAEDVSLRQRGVDHVLTLRATASEWAAVMADVSRGRPWGAPSVDDEPSNVERTDESEVAGRIIAVWGPTGAPGRSTVAVNLAAETALLGSPTLLVDADPYGGTLAQALALLGEAPGLAAAVRACDHGALDRADLARHAPEVVPDLRILTGLPKADRWTELRPAPLRRTLDIARTLSSTIVVDCGFCLEDDEALSYDTVAPRRNAATLTVLAMADEIVVVGAADPVGLQRLVRALDDLGQVPTNPAGRRTVVVNRVRSSAVGSGPAARIIAALERFAGVTDPWIVPDDQNACDHALFAGRTLAEQAPNSPTRLALRDLAGHLLGRPPGPPHRRFALRGRRRVRP